MRTQIAIQGILTNPDGSFASGTVIATPNSVIANGNSIWSESPNAGVLNWLGQIVAQSGYALEIGATDDSGTTPTGAAYTFTIKLDDSVLQEFVAAMPNDSTASESHGSTTLDSPIVTLADLVASEAMVGQAITGDNIPDDTTVVSIDYVPSLIGFTNKLTLSANATGSQTGCAFVVGGAVELASLLANAL